MNAMQVIQTYETTISSNDGNRGIACLVVPVRSIPKNESDFQGEDRARRIGLQPIERVSPSQLPYAVAALIAASEQEANPLELYHKILQAPVSAASELVGIETFQFAEEISCLPVVPFEQSPMDFASFAEIYATAGAVGLGAYAGFVAAGSTALLFVTIPAGMILFGAAAGIALGLQNGLKERVRKWLSGEPATDPGDTIPDLTITVDEDEGLVNIGGVVLPIRK
jgi:hypothetical protein